MWQCNPPVKRTIYIIKNVGLITSFFASLCGWLVCAWVRNWNAAGFSLILEIVCIILLRLNFFYHKDQLQLKITKHTLNVVQNLALIAWIVLLIAGIVNIYLGIVDEQNFYVQNKGNYVAAIPAFLGSFWSFVLFWDCKKYQLIVGTTIRLMPIQEVAVHMQ